jgi:hypothetical protein
MSRNTGVWTHADEESGTKLHVIYHRKSKRLQICVWEAASGRLVALDEAWLAEYQESDLDPIPDLVKVYGNIEDEGDDD